MLNPYYRAAAAERDRACVVNSSRPEPFSHVGLTRQNLPGEEDAWLPSLRVPLYGVDD